MIIELGRTYVTTEGVIVTMERRVTGIWLSSSLRHSECTDGTVWFHSFNGESQHLEGDYDSNDAGYCHRVAREANAFELG